MTDLDPEAYYDDQGAAEWDRLEANPVTRLELESTMHYLREHLPEAGHVLDAGGGAGRYAVRLAERGHDVTLLDVSAGQVAVARRKAAEYAPADRVAVGRGDVRALPLPDDAFDAVCCLGGPLSHVVDADRRRRAVDELRRVARPGAPVFVSVVGRLAALTDVVKRVLDRSHGLLVPLAEHGDYTAEVVAETGAAGSFAEFHAFRADELRALLESRGLAVETLAGLEGVASVMAEELSEASAAALDDVRAVVELLREDPAVVDASEHILAVCRA